AQRHDEGLGQYDLEEGDPLRQAERGGAFMLAARHAFDRPAQDFGLIGGGVEREGQERAVPGVAEEPPKAPGLQLGGEAAEAVIDQEELREERRAAEEIDIAVGQPREEAVL